ncbi:hypothetical protein DM01DRAFT_1075634 [Hesseltinella vesiculosa]|uniref:Uncharacterized protein n=1 Tax=Hesseltinella vesiculosa TaxID=101127 RepID=A0A1X2GW42_9FUNG|nr:hypothetical protein DM01DRAFT_1075634 [Hesseltinella vesiculosa]
MKIQSARTVFHLRITLSKLLQVILIVPDEKIEWYNNNDIHSKLIPTLYDAIVKQLIQNSNEPSKRKRDLEVKQKINKTGLFTLTYSFHQLSRPQAFLIRVHILRTDRVIHLPPYRPFALRAASLVG